MTVALTDEGTLDRLDLVSGVAGKNATIVQKMI